MKKPADVEVLISLMDGVTYKMAKLEVQVLLPPWRHQLNNTIWIWWPLWELQKPDHRLPLHRWALGTLEEKASPLHLPTLYLVSVLPDIEPWWQTQQCSAWGASGNKEDPLTHSSTTATVVLYSCEENSLVETGQLPQLGDTPTSPEKVQAQKGWRCPQSL